MCGYMANDREYVIEGSWILAGIQTLLASVFHMSQTQKTFFPNFERCFSQIVLFSLEQYIYIILRVLPEGIVTGLIFR